jgi:oligosaccharide repeat unit polymerase
MVILATIILALMAAVNYRIGGRRLLYPPAVFCAVWAGTLFLVWLANTFFFTLSDKTLIIFCGGGLAFSAGSAFALFFPSRPVEVRDSPNRVINLLLIVVACSAPFVVQWVLGLAAGFSSAPLLLAARMAMLESYEAGEASVLYGGFITLSLIVAMVCFLEGEHHKVRMYLALLIAFALNILAGGRAGIVGLIFAFICLDWLRHKRLHWKPLMGLALVFVFLFGAMAILLQKGEARADASLAENLAPVAEGFALYTGGGIVGFDQVVRQPNIIPHNWQINKFFLEAANKLGAHFDIPDLHAEFLEVGPNLSGNVYTMYFAYLDLGIGGMMLTTALVGFAVTFCFTRALQGSKLAMVLYSFFFGAILLSPFSENFFMGLNYSTKIFAVCWVVYNLPFRAAQFRVLLNRVVANSAAQM